MSDKEKKPQQAKPKYKSAGERNSGGRVPKLNINSLEFGLTQVQTQARIVNRATRNALKKAHALVRRAGKPTLGLYLP